MNELHQYIITGIFTYLAECDLLVTHLKEKTSSDADDNFSGTGRELHSRLITSQILIRGITIKRRLIQNANCCIITTSTVIRFIVHNNS